MRKNKSSSSRGKSTSTTSPTVVVPIVKPKGPSTKTKTTTIKENVLEHSIDNEDMIMMDEEEEDVDNVNDEEDAAEGEEKQDDDGEDDDEDDDDEEEEDDEDDQPSSSSSTKTKQKTKQNKTKTIDMLKKNSHKTASVIYICHLPSLFGEYELLTLLKQFGGTITHIRISRSEKTGNSRGYAFIRIIETDIANIIVNTLSGYLLFSQKDIGVHKRFVCHIVPNDKVHPRLFVKRTSAIEVAKLRKQKKLQPVQKSISKLSTMNQKLLHNERKKRMKLQQAGIDYDFPGYETKLATSTNVSSDKTTSTSLSNKTQPEKRTTQSNIILPKQKKQKLVEANNNNQTSVSAKVNKEVIATPDKTLTKKTLLVQSSVQSKKKQKNTNEKKRHSN